MHRDSPVLLSFGRVGAHKDIKGLEVDSAVVVEPARIIDEERQGVRSLYVALTRAIRRVAVVHTQPLPAMLRE